MLVGCLEFHRPLIETPFEFVVKQIQLFIAALKVIPGHGNFTLRGNVGGQKCSRKKSLRQLTAMVQKVKKIPRRIIGINKIQCGTIAIRTGSPHGCGMCINIHGCAGCGVENDITSCRTQ